jgi:hypothetical protein
MCQRSGSGSRTGRDATELFHDVSAGLADGGILVAGAATAAERADQLAALDQRKPSGARDQRGIKRPYPYCLLV